MRMILYAGALVLATAGLSLNSGVTYATEFTTSEHSQVSAAIDIGRIRSVLKLTPRQEPFWAPVEAALRGLAHRQAHAEEETGFVRRISRRVVSVVLNSAAIERLALAARPLIAVLSDDQKRAVSVLVQEMGLGPVVAALN